MWNMDYPAADPSCLDHVSMAKAVEVLAQYAIALDIFL